MLENIFLNILILGSLVGWGYLISKACGLAADSASNIFLNAILAIIPLGALALLLNFFIPIDIYVSGFVLSIGWISFLKFFRYKINKSWGLLAFALSGIFIISLAVDNNILGDSLLYHIPTMLWIKSEKIVLGLANVHDRFGFNSIWHLIVSLLTPYLSETTYVDPCGSAVMILFAGFVGSRCVEKYKKQDLAWLFYACIIFVFFGVLGKTANASTLGSPATDLISRMFATTLLILWWEWFENKNNKLALIVISMAIFIPMLKLSKVHMLIPGAVVAWTLWRTSLARKNIFWMIGSLGLVGIFWVVRTWLLSGCLVFPAPGTCTPVPWVLPMAEIIDINNWIKSWAREPMTNPELVLAGWYWLIGWVYRTWSLLPVKILSGLLLVSFVFGFKNWKKWDQRDKWILGYLLIAFGFWFFTAPDLRFILGVATFATAWVLEKSVRALYPRWKKQFKWGFILLVLVLGQDYLRVTLTTFKNFPLRKTQDYAKEVPGFTQKTSQAGVSYYVNQSGQFMCAFAPRPCAPFERSQLAEGTLGNYRVFKSQH